MKIEYDIIKIVSDIKKLQQRDNKSNSYKKDLNLDVSSQEEDNILQKMNSIRMKTFDKYKQTTEVQTLTN